MFSPDQSQICVIKVNALGCGLGNIRFTTLPSPNENSDVSLWKINIPSQMSFDSKSEL